MLVVVKIIATTKIILVTVPKFRGSRLPACFASAQWTFDHAFSHQLSILHRRFSTASNASCWPKIKQSPPTVTTIDLDASRMTTGGVGDEESASIDRCLHGCCCHDHKGRNRRLWSPAGG